MDITLNHLCPSYLAQSGSQIWKREVHISGETFVNVVAPSGKGKTSLVFILYGLLRAYSGALRFDGRDVADFGRRHWAHLRQRRLSLVFQDLRLFSNLTGRENVQINARQTGAVDVVLMESAFERLGIATLADTRVETFSQGERQRIAFIRAIAQPFDWILLDEPFSHVDDARVATMRDLLLEACQRRRAGMILTSLEASKLLPFHRTYRL